MKKLIYTTSLFIASIVLYSNAIGQDGYYYYIFDERIDMIINREYIAVKIDETLIDRSVKQIILKSARTSLFRPAQKNNQSVRCWVQVPLSLEV